MTFQPTDYFDLSQLYFADLFEDATNVWEALSGLDEYIAAQFESGRMKGNYHDKSDIFVGNNTTIVEGARIEGPAIIGKNCTIGHGAYIRGGCVIGDNVRIGHAVEVKHSIILSDAAIAHFNYVGDSIIGNHVNVSAGAVCANFRLDKKQIVVKMSDQRIETGLKKLGAIVGDGSNVGVNAVLNPGTILGKDCVVYPLTNVRGVHPEASRVLHPPRQSD